jgi:hypothetical protein
MGTGGRRLWYEQEQTTSVRMGTAAPSASQWARKSEEAAGSDGGVHEQVGKRSRCGCYDGGDTGSDLEGRRQDE